MSVSRYETGAQRTINPLFVLNYLALIVPREL